MNPRSEPLLWLQLIGLGVLPLEALLLLLLLAGSDPGRLPGLERLFTWAIGALLPGLLLLRRPADPFSLLLVSTPLRARRELQRRLATLQGAVAPKAGLVAGIAGALALLVAVDEHAALAAALSPLSGSPRLVALLLAALLLALMMWQWQQAIQAIWLLNRPEAAVAAAAPMPTADIGEQRLCIGLPLLLPDPLKLPDPAAVAPPPRPPRPPTPAAEPVAPIATSADEGEASTEPAPIEATATAPTPAAEPEPSPEPAATSETEPEAESIASPEVEVVAEAVPELAEPEAAVEPEADVEVVAEIEEMAEVEGVAEGESVAAVENEAEPPA